MKINREQMNTILNDAKEKGIDGKKLFDSFIKKGYEIEGVDTKKALVRITKEETQEKPESSIAEKISTFTGGKELAQGAGQALAAGEVNELSEQSLNNALDLQDRLIEGIKKAREIEDVETETKLREQLRKLDFGTQIQSDFQEGLVSDREVIGSAVQLAGTAAGGAAASRALNTLGTGVRGLAAAGTVEGAIQGVGFGAGEEIKQDEATLSSIAKAGLKDGLIGAAIGGAGAGLIGGTPALTRGIKNKVTNSITRPLDNVADSIQDFTKAKEIGDDVLTKVERKAGIREDVKKSILGEDKRIEEYFDVTRKRLTDDTAKTPTGLLTETAEKAFKETEQILSDTGNEIGRKRQKLGSVKANRDQVKSIVDVFNSELKSLGLVKGKNGVIKKAKGVVDVSDSELKLINEFQKDLSTVSGDAKIETIQKAINKLRNRVNFGKSSNEVSGVIDPLARRVSSKASEVNKSLLGNEAAEQYRKFSELSEFLKENKNIRKNPQVTLRRILSADSAKGLEFAETIKELTGIDLIKESRFARLAVDTFSDVNPELGTRFRQQLTDSGVDAGNILNKLPGKAGAIAEILNAVRDIPSSIQRERLLRQGIDPNLIDAEEMADLILRSARGSAGNPTP